MSRHPRRGHESLCRDALAQTEIRLDTLRRAVERRPGVRRELERALDDARGLHNRALARVEATRQAGEESWPFARAQADQAMAEMQQALDELELRLARAAA